MTASQNKLREAIIYKIRETDYKLENLHYYIDHLIKRAESQPSEDEDDFTDHFGQIGYAIMRVWFIARELDKMMTKEQEQKS